MEDEQSNISQELVWYPDKTRGLEKQLKESQEVSNITGQGEGSEARIN